MASVVFGTALARSMFPYLVPGATADVDLQRKLILSTEAARLCLFDIETCPHHVFVPADWTWASGTPIDDLRIVPLGEVLSAWRQNGKERVEIAKHIPYPVIAQFVGGDRADEEGDGGIDDRFLMEDEDSSIGTGSAHSLHWQVLVEGLSTGERVILGPRSQDRKGGVAGDDGTTSGLHDLDSLSTAARLPSRKPPVIAVGGDGENKKQRELVRKSEWVKNKDSENWYSVFDRRALHSIRFIPEKLIAINAIALTSRDTSGGPDRIGSTHEGSLAPIADEEYHVLLAHLRAVPVLCSMLMSVLERWFNDIVRLTPSSTRDWADLLDICATHHVLATCAGMCRDVGKTSAEPFHLCSKLLDYLLSMVMMTTPPLGGDDAEPPLKILYPVATRNVLLWMQQYTWILHVSIWGADVHFLRTVPEPWARSIVSKLYVQDAVPLDDVADSPRGAFLFDPTSTRIAEALARLGPAKDCLLHEKASLGAVIQSSRVKRTVLTVLIPRLKLLYHFCGESCQQMGVAIPDNVQAFTDPNFRIWDVPACITAAEEDGFLEWSKKTRKVPPLPSLLDSLFVKDADKERTLADWKNVIRGGRAAAVGVLPPLSVPIESFYESTYRKKKKYWAWLESPVSLPQSSSGASAMDADQQPSSQTSQLKPVTEGGWVRSSNDIALALRTVSAAPQVPPPGARPGEARTTPLQVRPAPVVPEAAMAAVAMPAPAPPSPVQMPTGATAMAAVAVPVMEATPQILADPSTDESVTMLHESFKVAEARLADQIKPRVMQWMPRMLSGTIPEVSSGDLQADDSLLSVVMGDVQWQEVLRVLEIRDISSARVVAWVTSHPSINWNVWNGLLVVLTRCNRYISQLLVGSNPREPRVTRLGMELFGPPPTATARAARGMGTAHETQNDMELRQVRAVYAALTEEEIRRGLRAEPFAASCVHGGMSFFVALFVEASVSNGMTFIPQDTLREYYIKGIWLRRQAVEAFLKATKDGDFSAIMLAHHLNVETWRWGARMHNERTFADSLLVSVVAWFLGRSIVLYLARPDGTMVRDAPHSADLLNKFGIGPAPRLVLERRDMALLTSAPTSGPRQPIVLLHHMPSGHFRAIAPVPQQQIPPPATIPSTADVPIQPPTSDAAMEDDSASVAPVPVAPPVAPPVASVPVAPPVASATVALPPVVTVAPPPVVIVTPPPVVVPAAPPPVAPRVAPPPPPPPSPPVPPAAAAAAAPIGQMVKRDDDARDADTDRLADGLQLGPDGSDPNYEYTYIEMNGLFAEARINLRVGLLHSFEIGKGNCFFDSVVAAAVLKAKLLEPRHLTEDGKRGNSDAATLLRTQVVSFAETQQREDTILGVSMDVMMSELNRRGITLQQWFELMRKPETWADFLMTTMVASFLGARIRVWMVYKHGDRLYLRVMRIEPVGEAKYRPGEGIDPFTQLGAPHRRFTLDVASIQNSHFFPIGYPSDLSRDQVVTDGIIARAQDDQLRHRAEVAEQIARDSEVAGRVQVQEE